MRRRKVICLLSLAGLSILHGCADSSVPKQVGLSIDAPSVSRNSVVLAAHYEPTSQFDRSQPTQPIATSSVATSLDRLPLLDHVVNSPLPVNSYPRTDDQTTNQAAPAHRFDRLPALNCVAAVQPRPYAIDLTEADKPAPPAPTISVLPQVVKIVTEKEAARPAQPVVPQKRFVEAKPPKPPLPAVSKASVAAPSGSAGWLMTGNALTAVSQRADGMIDRGFQLAEKGAFYSARTEFRQALRTVTQALDTHFGTNEYSESLEAGWLALEEADDFSAHSQRGPRVDVELIVESHQTQVLKNYDLQNVTPVLAMQHYFAFAQEQLVKAGGRAPVAARALHGLGKVHMVLGEQSGSAERLHGPKAMAFQQAALTTDPGNFMAANELGVLLARFGKLQEARNVLQYAVSFYPLPETWQNLSIVHHRLGEATLAAQSNANWQIALQQEAAADPATRQANNRSMIQWVPPQAFVEQNPNASNVPVMPANAVPPEQPLQAKKKSGFLWW